MIKGIENTLKEYNDIRKKLYVKERLIINYFRTNVRKAKKCGNDENLIKILELAPEVLHNKILNS